MTKSISKPQNPHIVLASTSRYRAELLSRLQLEFSQFAPQIDEQPLPEEIPAQTAKRLARAKAQAGALAFPDAIVIGSDQVGVCGGRQLGKPGTVPAAIEQLISISGAKATFHTAVAVFDPHGPSEPLRIRQAMVDTHLKLRPFTDEQAAAYVMADNPLDCAGSFKVESLGITLFEDISSPDPTALIGLPLIALTDLLPPGLLS